MPVYSIHVVVRIFSFSCNIVNSSKVGLPAGSDFFLFSLFQFLSGFINFCYISEIALGYKKLVVLSSSIFLLVLCLSEASIRVELTGVAGVLAIIAVKVEVSRVEFQICKVYSSDLIRNRQASSTAILY